ncbi:MAPEG family protein [Bacteriovorax sp. BSW11_IV]|uniref:MAPEG family protein n=1 Tax=Bacteriovorax sp. BSW11_IV TaxID=1353529 RepID=UPI00038A553A|nr:MAPEG family protein [Bacteriovorax sp. BSW11_IV]EQC49020.1 MAPEG family protein [Bacteriovorax sp. BSW11_IV]
MITSITIALLIFISMAIAIKTIQMRSKLRIPYGHDNNRTLMAYTSAHNNFITYAPLMVIALYVIETLIVIPMAFTLTLGLAIVISRLLHAYALMVKETASKPNFSWRVKAMGLTFIILTSEALICLILPFKIYFQS